MTGKGNVIYKPFCAATQKKMLATTTTTTKTQIGLCRPQQKRGGEQVGRNAYFDSSCCGCSTILNHLKLPQLVILITALVLILMSDIAQCMEMAGVDVPRFPVVGSRTKLRCNYKLNGDRLYSVKWYKDGHEFYRYVPRDDPPSQVFNVPWIGVDQHQSNDRWVTLRDLTLGSSGTFTCEASSEAPRFKTVSRTGTLQVIDLPDSSPILRHNLNAAAGKGSSSKPGGGAGPAAANASPPAGYRVGDMLDVNCTSLRSKPPAQLSWYINGEKVDSAYVKKSPVVTESGGLFTVNLRLHFKLKRYHFVQGHVSVKCTAEIFNEYFQSSKLNLPGIGLGEKALGISGRSTNGAVDETLLSLVHLLMASNFFLIISRPVHWLLNM